MLRYLLRRAGQALVVLVGAAVLVFFLLQLVPGDPVRAAMGTRFKVLGARTPGLAPLPGLPPQEF